MKLGLKRNKILVGVIVLNAILLALIFFWDPLFARYGTPLMRQVVMSKWVNQQRKLGSVQKRICFTLLYKDVGDPDAAGTALAVLNAHLAENEDEIVRHLVYTAFTTTNLLDRGVALSGLRRVSEKHKAVATAAFLYFLTHSNPSNRDDALNIVFCVDGLANYSYVDALPIISKFTNSPNALLSYSARECVLRLESKRQNVQKRKN